MSASTAVRRAAFLRLPHAEFGASGFPRPSIAVWIFAVSPPQGARYREMRIRAALIGKFPGVRPGLCVLVWERVLLSHAGWRADRASTDTF